MAHLRRLACREVVSMLLGACDDRRDEMKDLVRHVEGRSTDPTVQRGLMLDAAMYSFGEALVHIRRDDAESAFNGIVDALSIVRSAHAGFGPLTGCECDLCSHRCDKCADRHGACEAE